MGTPTIRIRQLLLLLLFYDAGRLSDAAESGGRKNQVLQVDKASKVHKSSNDTISTVESLFSPSQSWSITTSTLKFNTEQVTANQRSVTPILHALLHPISSPEYRPLHRQPLPMHANNDSFTTVIKKASTLETSALFKPSIKSEIRHFLFSRSANGAFQPQNLSVSDQLSASINASPFLANRSTPVQKLQTLLANGESSLIEKRDSSTQDQNNVFPKSHIVNIPGVPHNSTFSDLNGSSLKDNNASVHTLYIGGLFELSSRDGPNGYSELDAALLAISHINDQNIIPGYKLNLLYNDSKVSNSPTRLASSKPCKSIQIKVLFTI
ncbi:gamma-aminobutyric acid type B receptor subunit 1 [Biomphalaria pfeifferi]|uniref:Gamma-aminobutyric acid type B receptor subunit 1 n=1 Tax=Biomphalaria pfeifferi TaxID=112525 RepID=A0AAD8C1D4_BIOPF|nr:gamma-aminobutyric acid type B receptor subunit 1 [Biomphalaria pfeifferi]